MRAIKPADKMELGVAAGTILLGLFILVDSLGIRLGSGYDRIGPRFFPYVVATGLLITGVLMLVEILRSTSRTESPQVNKTSFIFLACGLVACLFLLKPAGFIIAASVQFWLIARAFSSVHAVRDAITALLLSVSVYFVFTRGLGLNLPGGIFTGLI